MKFKLHIPTMEYGFIEAELDGEIEEAIIAHDIIADKASEAGNMTDSEWKKARMTMLLKGEHDPNDSERLSRGQRYFINQAKLAFRDIKEQE